MNYTTWLRSIRHDATHFCNDSRGSDGQMLEKEAVKRKSRHIANGMPLQGTPDDENGVLTRGVGLQRLLGTEGKVGQSCGGLTPRCKLIWPVQMNPRLALFSSLRNKL